MGKKELKILENVVKDEIDNLEKELGRTDKNPLTSSLQLIVPIAVALGLSFILGILTYWLPASFIVLIIWYSYSIAYSKKKLKIPISKRALVARLKSIKQFHRTLTYFAQIFVKDLYTISKAVLLVFSINLITLLLTFGGILSGAKLSLIVPLVTTLFLISPIIILFWILGSVQTLSLAYKPRSTVKLLSITGSLSIPALFASIGLFIWSFAITSSFVKNYALLILTVLFQLICLATLWYYFSRVDTRKEIKKSISQLRGIMDELNGFKLEERGFSKEDFERLSTSYMEAKKFTSFGIDDFLIVEIQSIIPNKKYLEDCIQKDITEQREKTKPISES